MWIRDACPKCRAQQFKKNGHIHTGKQNDRCKPCGRQFVVHAANRVINEDQDSLVERLLLEKISLHGICRVVGVNIRRKCIASKPYSIQISTKFAKV